MAGGGAVKVDVRGKSIVITGGAGGIAGGIAGELAAGGAVVALLDLASDRLEAAAAAIGAVAVALDVTDEQSVEHAMDAAADRAGGVDGLVVTAGLQLHGEDGPIGAVPLDVWNRTMLVNLTGAFLSVKHAIRHLTARPTSSVVLIGSPTGLTMSGAGYTAYAASKAGMMALARTIAADHAHLGLRANVIVPGTIETPLIRGLLEDETSRSALIAGTPLRRLGRPEDLAGIARWLLSDAASFATGGFFAVDGGLTAR